MGNGIHFFLGDKPIKLKLSYGNILKTESLEVMGFFFNDIFYYVKFVLCHCEVLKVEVVKFSRSYEVLCLNFKDGLPFNFISFFVNVVIMLDITSQLAVNFLRA